MFRLSYQRAALMLAGFVLLGACGKPEIAENVSPPQEPPLAEAPATPVPEPDTAEPPPPPEPDTPEESVDTTSTAAILGYHRFSESPNISRRLLSTTIFIDKFREQMQTLKDNDISVISLGDFLAWRRGEKSIPPFSVIITIDDGYVSTYNLAFPILKEFGFPFTLYLYSNFLGGAGKTLSYEEIHEMLAAGGEIGSHSVSHASLTRRGRRSEEMQAAYLKAEAEDSRRILREKLGVDPKTFSYPYGIYDEAVIEACVNAEYEAMVTVRGQKVDWKSDLKELGRYIVHGSDDRPFNYAISSRVPGGFVNSTNLMKETQTDEATGETKPLITVSPPNNSKVPDRRPVIQVDLSALKNVEMDSLKMIISSLGPVTPSFDEETAIVSYQPHQRLRLPEYWVQLRLQRTGEKKPDMIRWNFLIDGEANYLSKVTPLSEETPIVESESAETPN